jgi:hypothetical protein
MSEEMKVLKNVNVSRINGGMKLPFESDVRIELYCHPGDQIRYPLIFPTCRQHCLNQDY